MELDVTIRAGSRIVVGGVGVLLAAFILASGWQAPDDSVPFALVLGIPAVLLLAQARRLLSGSRSD